VAWEIGDVVAVLGGMEAEFVGRAMTVPPSRHRRRASR
jgi:hypothetical protein